MITIRMAQTAGFCFGVKRAVDEAYQQAEQGEIYTFGPIIHNEEVVLDLQKKGVRILQSMEEMEQTEPGTVLIRSHGVSDVLEQNMKSLGWRVVDMTCPFVKKIHRIVAQESRNGKVILIAGNPRHPEVEGIIGCCHGPVFTIESERDLQNLPLEPEKTYCLVAQTTFNFQKFKILVDQLTNLRYDSYVAQTICNATQERQREAAQIATEVDVMLVIGGSHSSNTQKLYEICKKECNNTHYIQTAADLNEDWFHAGDTVGVTAGASTPNNIIQEVIDNVRGFWTVIK